ncbi:acyltransferase family protein [Novosphingobium cyanobacteriorum]|uniref:Acyltransferase n=1 Tax=Novosphingobium cyanobacteriorum TaxID=3024215 RepID=A0ABT6CKL1_9SPHN|nr:acyltransferase [Novosphingobium cyanobacteriorum]MDF8334088.1 acyltransferase [Novosphingobium cyanobacteriorum]
MPKRIPIHGLDLLRMAAAAMVMLYHLAFKALAMGDNTLLIASGKAAMNPPWTGATWFGWIGVQVFFVISGAVIAYSSTGVSARSFAERRFARLWPALAICATLALIVPLVTDEMWDRPALSAYARTLTFFPFGPWIMGQFWTLPIEVMFYGVIWLLIAAGQGQRLEELAWALGLASAAYWVVHVLLPIPDGRIMALLLVQHGCFFALGMIVAKGDADGFHYRHGLLGGICVAAAALQIRTAAGWELEGFPVLQARWIVPFLAWLAVCVALVLSFRAKEAIARFVGKQAAALRMCGMMTYPLYLIHMHTGGPVLVLLRKAGFGDAVAIAASLGVAVVAAWVVARWIEPPLHGLVKDALAALPGRRSASRAAA